VAGYALADKAQWEQYALRLSSFSIRWWRDVCERVEVGEPLQLVDVRSRAEWLQGHLPGAISLPLLTISSAASSIDFSKPSLLYCQQGYRAATAASLLMRESIANVGVLMGSEGAWQAGHPDPIEAGQLEYAG
jgi:rhodanese-related sulfurtransferase